MVTETQMQQTERDLRKSQKSPKTHTGFEKNSNEGTLMLILNAFLRCQVAQNKPSPFPFSVRPLHLWALLSSQIRLHHRAARCWGCRMQLRKGLGLPMGERKGCCVHSWLEKAWPFLGATARDWVSHLKGSGGPYHSTQHPGNHLLTEKAVKSDLISLKHGGPWRQFSPKRVEPQEWEWEGKREKEWQPGRKRVKER